MAAFLKEVDAQRPCPISGTHKAMVICEKDRHKSPLRNVMNKKSCLIYVDPVPFQNTEEFYKTEYRKSYKGVHQPKPKHVYRAGKVALARFSRLMKYLNSDSICLDAGSSSGEFVYLLNSKGFDAQGVEANLPYADYSQAELSLSVTKAPFSEFKNEKKFDIITMFHVLEHLENPIRDLSHLRDFLKPYGKLIVEVPNILYPNMAFSHKWHPGHLLSFTDNTLACLLEKAGFKTLTSNPIGDGGNLWGVFEKPKDSEAERDTLSKMPSANEVFENLLTQRTKYYLRLSNFFKIFRKIPVMISEKVESRSLTGKEILDRLYKDHSF